MGLVTLVGGALLGSFSLRAESTLIDPGLDEADHGFFDTQGIKVPGAEAKTEKLPTSGRPTCPRTDRSDRARFRARAGAIAGSAGLCAGAVSRGDGAAVCAGLSAAARCGVDAAVATCPMPHSGLSEAAPRALPQDFAVALASAVIDGGVVVKLLVGARAVVGRLGRGAAGGGGAARGRHRGPVRGGHDRDLESLCRRTASAGALEPARRLRMPAVGGDDDVAAAHIDTATGPVCGALVFWIALAGLTPTGLMLAATVAVVVRVRARGPAGRGGCARRWRWAAAVVAALPWLTAAMVAGSLSSSQAEGVPAFAARAEPGSARSAAWPSLGGIWNGDAVPASRTTLFAVVAAAGAARHRGRRGCRSLVRRPVAVPLLVLAAVAVVVPAVMATGPGLAGVEATIRALPGLGVVRDAQKWVASGDAGLRAWRARPRSSRCGAGFLPRRPHWSAAPR